jgi:putative flippase GtrA
VAWIASAMKETAGQFLRYATVGLFSNGVIFLFYLAITAAGIEHKIAMTLLYMVGVAQTFLFNKRWSFKHRGKYGPEFIRYCLAYGMGYVLNLIVLMIVVDRLGFPHQVIQGIMIVILAVLLFFLQKFWVFRTKPSPQAPKDLTL